MLVQHTFAKDIFRPIDPVVKANSTEHLKNELEEFVITPEVERHLLTFFDEYNDPGAVGNGAWISGFFGSGKSHLLKILAYVLENRDVDGKGAMEYLLPKVEHDVALRSAMMAAVQKHPSESILFNIDSVAPNQGKSDSGALLAAFIKTFNEHCGYFSGDQQHIAQLEYDLDRDGKLESFIQLVEAKTGKDWETVRKQALLHAKKITAAFDEVVGHAPGTTDNVVTYYQKTYQPDIVTFAKRVKEYIDQRGYGFRLNFFVDEVGQFIAQNTNLMVNLQSVAEELNNICGGDSWVIVTSQEDMSGIVGQMDKSSANDFSKIQARFNVRMPLSSSDAKTVIKNRLLAKDPASFDAFYGLYSKYHDDFGVLFDFADGMRKYPGYAGFDDFLNTYPFVPYQFELFINCMRKLSEQNAFTGRHSSVGARSMLGVFQDVAQRLCIKSASIEEGNLASFDMMFEGLRNNLRSEFYAAISQAENSGLSETAVRLLKVLLLVKFLGKEFRTTPANLRVLLYGAFVEHTVELESDIQDALAELESQVYIRKTENGFEYLTDEEKEIENAIKNTVVPDSKNKDLIAELFRDVVGQLRVTYKNGSFSSPFSYNLKVDGDLQGQQRHDLTVDLLTSFSTDGLLGSTVMAGPKTLAIKLNDSGAFLKSVRTHNQTERYINVSSTSDNVRESIIVEKRKQNQELRVRLVEEMRTLLTNATYNAAGTDVTLQVKGAASAAVESGVLELIRRSYTGLQQLSSSFSDQQIYQQCVSTQLMSVLPEYCETVLNRISLLSSDSGVVTVSGDGMGSLVGYFTKNEYGWPESAVRSAVAQLFAANKIEVKKYGHALEAAQLASILSKHVELDKLVIEKVDAISSEDMALLQKTYKDITGTSAPSNDAKMLAKSISETLKLAAENASTSNVSPYPFAHDFWEVLGRVQSASKSTEDWKWTVYQLPKHANSIRDDVDNLRRMAEFSKGSLLEKRWRDLKSFLDVESPNLKILRVDDSELGVVSEIVNDPCCFRSSRMPEAKAIVDRMRKELAIALERLREAEVGELHDLRESFVQNYDFSKLNESNISEFKQLFKSAEQQLVAETNPTLIRGFVERFSARKTAQIVKLLTPVIDTPPTPPGDEPRHRTVRVADIKASGYSKPLINDEADADAFLSALKAEIMGAIARGDFVTTK